MQDNSLGCRGLQFSVNLCLRMCVVLWTVTRQAPLSMGFSRQVYWSVLPCSTPGDFPNPGTEPVFLMSPALAGSFFTTSTNWEVLECGKC